MTTNSVANSGLDGRPVGLTTNSVAPHTSATVTAKTAAKPHAAALAEEPGADGKEPVQIALAEDGEGKAGNEAKGAPQASDGANASSQADSQQAVVSSGSSAAMMASLYGGEATSSPGTATSASSFSAANSTTSIASTFSGALAGSQSVDSSAHASSTFGGFSASSAQAAMYAQLQANQAARNEVQVVSVDHAPVGTDGAVETTAGHAVGGVVVASDVDGDHLSYGIRTAAAHGTVSMDASGHYTYTPADGFTGTDSFIVQVSDGRGGVVQVHETITVNAAEVVNHAPELTSTHISGHGEIDGSLTATDADSDTVTFAVAAGGAPGHGAVSIDSDGTFAYTPDEGWHGSDSFTVALNDGHGGTTTHAVTVASDDAAPTVTGGDTEGSAAIGHSVLGTLTLADTDGDTLTVTITGAPSHGLAVLDGADWAFTAEDGYVGDDSFTVTVSDGHGGSVEQEITVHTTDPGASHTDLSDISVTAGEAIDITAGTHFTSVDGTNLTYTATLDGNALGDSGLSIDATTGELTGNLTDVGEHQIVITATDGHGVAVDEAFAVTVGAATETVVGPDQANAVSTNNYYSAAVTLPDAATYSGDTIVQNLRMVDAGTTGMAEGTEYNFAVTWAVQIVDDTPTWIPTVAPGGPEIYSAQLMRFTGFGGNGQSENMANTDYTSGQSGGACVVFQYTTDGGQTHGGTLICALGFDMTTGESFAMDTTTAHHNEYQVSAGNDGAFSITSDGAHDVTFGNGSGNALTYTAESDVSHDTIHGGGGQDSIIMTDQVQADFAIHSVGGGALTDNVTTGTSDIDLTGSDSSVGTININAASGATATITNIAADDSHNLSVNFDGGTGGAGDVSINGAAAQLSIIGDSDVGAADVVTEHVSGSIFETIILQGDQSHTHVEVVGDGYLTTTAQLSVGDSSWSGTSMVGVSHMTDASFDVSHNAMVVDIAHGDTLRVATVSSDGSSPISGAAGGNVVLIQGQGGTLADISAMLAAGDVQAIAGTVIFADSDMGGAIVVVHATNMQDLAGTGTITTVLSNLTDANSLSAANVMAHDPTVQSAALEHVNVAPIVSDVTEIVMASGLTATVAINAWDSDGDTLSYSTQDGHGPAHGQVTWTDNSFVYTPTDGFSGADSFSVEVNDGMGGIVHKTVSINVVDVSGVVDVRNATMMGDGYTAAGGYGDASVAGATAYHILSAGTHGTLSINNDGTFRYFTTDHTSADVAYVMVDTASGSHIEQINLTQDHVAPTVDLGIDRLYFLDRGDQVAFGIDSQGAHGSVQVWNDGTFAYSVADGYVGADSFTLNVHNAYGGSTQQVVNITVAADGTYSTDNAFGFDAWRSHRDNTVVNTAVGGEGSAHNDYLEISHVQDGVTIDLGGGFNVLGTGINGMHADLGAGTIDINGTNGFLTNVSAISSAFGDHTAVLTGGLDHDQLIGYGTLIGGAGADTFCPGFGSTIEGFDATQGDKIAFFGSNVHVTGVDYVNDHSALIHTDAGNFTMSNAHGLNEILIAGNTIQTQQALTQYIADLQAAGSISSHG